MAGADPCEAIAAITPPHAGTDEWAAFAASFRLLRSKSPGWPAELEHVCGWYEPHLERRHDNADVRRADLRQLEAIAAGYPSRERFLTELTLDPPGATSDEAGAPLKDEDYLILSTIHSAKGQEWRAVTLLNAVDGCIPSDLSTGTTAELEEERRLLYVAMTRAKDHLTLVVPQRFYVHQQGSGRRPARLRVADAVHSGGAGRAVRAGKLAGRGERIDAGCETAACSGSRSAIPRDVDVAFARRWAVGHSRRDDGLSAWCAFATPPLGRRVRSPAA